MEGISGKTSVLFVCMGNICRSPAAEAVFRYHVQESGYASLFHVDSAGTIGYHTGSPPDSRMRQAAGRRGYRLDSVARQVTPADLEIFDLVIAMDHDNLAALRALAPEAGDSVRLLGSFLIPEAGPADIPPVPDPYYGGKEGFEKVLDMIESACPAMLDHGLRLVRRQAG